MTTQIQTTAAMRRFNRVLERADLLYHWGHRIDRPELGLGQLYVWLDSHGCDKTSEELRLAGEAVGYFKEVV